LFVPVTVGLANNGDFGKVLDWFGISTRGTSEYQYVETTYPLVWQQRRDTEFLSSEILLTGLGLLVNLPWAAGGRFALAAGGIVHCALFFAAFAVAAPILSRLRPEARWPLAAASLLLLADTGYTVILNSFYQDTATLLFLLLAASCAARALAEDDPARGRRWLYAALASSLLFACSKTSHAPAGWILTALVLWLLRARWSSLAWATASICLYAWLGTPGSYAQTNAYSNIFYALLPSAPDPKQEIVNLGLPSDWARLTGTHGFHSEARIGDPAFVAEFSARQPYLLLARHYFLRPASAWRVILYSAGAPDLWRPDNIGNFPRSAGRPPYARTSFFTASSTLKSWTIARWRPFGVAYAALAAAAFCLLAFRAGPRIFAVALALSGLILVELLVSTLADGVENARHLTTFNLAADLALLSALALLPAWRRRPQ
jgi:hypothetical protein